jgi:hypothetical protein
MEADHEAAGLPTAIKSESAEAAQVYALYRGALIGSLASFE